MSDLSATGATEAIPVPRPASASSSAALLRLGLDWRAAIEAELPAAVALRHELHAAPDVSGAEEPTAERVVQALLGVISGPVDAAASDLKPANGATAADHRPGPVATSLETVAGTGRLLRFGPPGPAIGLRSELDALPVREQTGAPFAATNGAMHACGHDVHLAGLVAVVRAARDLDLPFGLVALLQPREEVGPTGASDVVAGRHLLEHDVRALIAAHVQPQVPAGHISADPGPVNAAVDEVEIVITGRGGHAAYPHLAVDPVPALCRAVLALQDTARSAVDPLHPVVVSMTQLSGSGAPNVIPDTATAAGTIRVMHQSDRERLHRRISATIAGIAAAHGCSGEYRIRRGEPVLVNDEALAAGAQTWLSEFGLPTAPFASCGSDDFATYSPQVPILMQFVGTGHEPPGPMLHDAGYLPEDGVVRDVALALLAGWLSGAQSLLS